MTAATVGTLPTPYIHDSNGEFAMRPSIALASYAANFRAPIHAMIRASP